MTELTRMGSIESSGVTEQLQQLSVSPPRHEGMAPRPATPPRQAFQHHYHQSSPSLMDASPSVAFSPRQMPTRNTPRQQQHELTPVMRNTTNFMEDSTNMVSPDEDANMLRAKGLTLNLSSSSRPPLQRRSLMMPIPMADRTRSLGHIGEFDEEDDEDEDLVALPEEQEPAAAIEFPSRKKFFSFNSRLQYNDQQQQQQQQQQASILSSRQTPYQPSRHDLSDVGGLPREELSSIFTNRDEMHRPISMEERQYSIPSIHLASNLNGGSTTDYTDEEDALEDDASWSSRGSSLYLPDENDMLFPTPTTGLKQVLRFTQQAPTNDQSVIIVEGPLLSEIFIPQTTDSSINNNDYETVDAVACSSKRAKHEQVYEWLRTVEGDHDMVAEAASSKFLTRQRPMPEMLARQKSSPPEVN